MASAHWLPWNSKSMQDTMSLMDCAAAAAAIVVVKRGAEHVPATCDTLCFRRRYTTHQFHLVLASCCCCHYNNFIFRVKLISGRIDGFITDTEALGEASQKQTNNNTTGKENKFHLIVKAELIRLFLFLIFRVSSGWLELDETPIALRGIEYRLLLEQKQRKKRKEREQILGNDKSSHSHPIHLFGGGKNDDDDDERRGWRGGETVCVFAVAAPLLDLIYK